MNKKQALHSKENGKKKWGQKKRKKELSNKKKKKNVAKIKT
jgi:hypothetical protein